MTCVTVRARRRHLVAILCALLAAPVLSAAGQQPGDYIIGPQDVLSITVFNQADLSGKYAVEHDGSFSFPLIGRVTAGGLSIRAVEEELRAKLADGFFNSPEVTVAVEQYRSQRVFIVGEIKNAGMYALAGDMTLIEALAKAGSTTADAGDEAVIVRGQGGASAAVTDTEGKEVVRVNLRDLQSGEAAVANVVLNDGDTIYIPRAEHVYVFGQVKNPGSYPIHAGTTVLQALALAGGVTPYAATNRVQVIRAVNGRKQELRIKLVDLVQPGDTIVVPERFF